MYPKLILISAIIISTVLIINFFPFYPSDSYLVDNFNTNRAEFEKLITMIQEDNKVLQIKKDGEVLDISYQKNSNLLSKERLNEYKRLLNKVNALEIRIHTDNKKDNSDFSSIDLSVFERPGFLMGGSYTSYTFTNVKQERIVDFIDKLYYQGGDALAYKPISENWYLCLDAW